MRAQRSFRRSLTAKRFLIFAYLTASLTLSAAGHPSFIGTWKMDGDKSDFGMMPRVSQITDRIAQSDAGLTIARNRDGRDVTIAVPLDGSSKDNDIMGTAMKTEGHWDADALTVDFSGLRNGKPVGYKERWTLAPDGKSFTIARHLTSARGSTDQNLIMVKQ